MPLMLPAPSRQIYQPPEAAPNSGCCPSNPAAAQSEINPDLLYYLYPNAGQINPYFEEYENMSHGRHLAGYGESPDGIGAYPNRGYKPQTGYGAGYGDYTGAENQGPEGTPRSDPYLQTTEREDDVYGSGIFNTGGATVHPDMGVFADTPSIPGYIGREVQYAVNKEIEDISNGADIVTVAGGGMTYQERGGQMVPFKGFGQGEHARTAAPIAVHGRVPAVPRSRSVAWSRNRGAVNHQTTAWPAMYGRPIPGFGAAEEDKSVGWGTYAFYGTVLGISAGMLWHLVKK